MERPLRRDRRGRGLRGPLAPPAVPLSRTRSERFEDFVLDAVERLGRRWDDQLTKVDFAVEQVPPDGSGAPASADGDPGFVPFGRHEPAGAGRNARVVIYRRPVESRATAERELAALVHDVVVEQVAELLGVEPETLDPRYGGRDDDH